MTLEELHAEEGRIRKRVQRRLEENQKDGHRLTQIRRQVNRLKLKALEGVSNGVRIAHRIPSGEKGAILNDALGTIVKVNRTRALVKFEVDEREWNVPLDELIPATQEQGLLLRF